MQKRKLGNSGLEVSAFAICQPDEVHVNEILFRPTRQEL
jgi:hypothetical protein